MFGCGADAFQRLAKLVLRAVLTLLCCFDVSAGAPASAQTASTRVALLIANSDYWAVGALIPTASQDARLLSNELVRARFDVDVRENLGKGEVQSAVDAFLARIGPGSSALFYFTGFGVQVDRQSYLVPTDAQVGSEDDVKREGINIDSLLGEMSRRGAQVKVAIIDASRHNPYERQLRGSFTGLAAVDAPEGTLTLYSAAPGRSSNEETGDTSLFMGELAKEFRSAGITAEEVFMHARLGVSRASNGEQIPWVASSLVDDFSFAGGDAAGPPPPSPRAQATAAAPPAPEPVVRKKPPQPPTPAKPRPSAPLVQLPPTPAAAVPPAPGSDQAAPRPPVSGFTPASVGPTPSPPPVRQAQAPAQPSPPAVRATVPEASSDKDPAVASNPIQDCSDCPELLPLPAGAFDMGSGTTPFDRPVHKVTIKPFALGVTEVTFDDWDKCASSGGCRFRPDDRGWGGGDRPVVNVSWSDAQQYTAWLSKQAGHQYRLSTEAEWEYAARGGKPTAFAWGSSVGAKMANCRDCRSDAGARTMPVRTFPPNGFGLFDMAGNAAEWVQDCWNETYRSAPRDGSAWLSGACDQRVLRGGSFDSNSAYVKPAARFRYDADVRYYTNGFRVARDLP